MVQLTSPLNGGSHLSQHFSSKKEHFVSLSKSRLCWVRENVLGNLFAKFVKVVEEEQQARHQYAYPENVSSRIFKGNIPVIKVHTVAKVHQVAEVSGRIPTAH